MGPTLPRCQTPPYGDGSAAIAAGAARGGEGPRDPAGSGPDNEALVRRPGRCKRAIVLGSRDRTSQRSRPHASALPRSTARAVRAVLPLAGAVAALVAGAGACDSSTSTAIVPTTGIVLRAETLTAGRGCGTGPTQLSKYAVVVFGIDAAAVGTAAEGELASYRVPVTSAVFDCYADGVFVSLPSTRGNSTFRLEVYAYNSSDFAAAEALVDRIATTPDATVLRQDGAPAEQQTPPTWTTVCTATQQQEIRALASCSDLAPGLAGIGGAAGATTITLATGGPFVLPNGRIASCASGALADAGSDAAAFADGDSGADAGADASSEVGDAATDGAAEAGSALDAGAPVTFTTVRVRPRVGATIVGPTVELACPAPYAAEVSAEPASYTLDVALFDSAGNLVDPSAQTICSVTSKTGRSSAAVCP